jgi:hypothetical protein
MGSLQGDHRNIPQPDRTQTITDNTRLFITSPLLWPFAYVRWTTGIQTPALAAGAVWTGCPEPPAAYAAYKHRVTPYPTISRPLPLPPRRITVITFNPERSSTVSQSGASAAFHAWTEVQQRAQNHEDTERLVVRWLSISAHYPS